ncbi:MAG: nucleoside triphosphate pyrophosphohydrolase [Rhodospirillales bacterium]
MSPIDQLLAIMERLRDPNGGCPWDLAQTFATIAPYTVEEAYEVADAISREDIVALRDELGDLLLQVVFHAQMAKEAGSFDFADVVGAICDKMLRRHPHVFADAEVADAAAQTEAWERHKAAERAAARSAGTNGDGPDQPAESLLDGIPRAMPPVLRAIKLQKRATLAGFDWPDAAGPLAKLREEIAELEAAMTNPTDPAVEDELGDVLFTCANLARKLGIDPDQALHRASDKFESRFRRMEAVLKAEHEDERPSLDVLEGLWQRAKREV